MYTISGKGSWMTSYSDMPMTTTCVLRIDQTDDDSLYWQARCNCGSCDNCSGMQCHVARRCEIVVSNNNNNNKAYKKREDISLDSPHYLLGKRGVSLYSLLTTYSLGSVTMHIRSFVPMLLHDPDTMSQDFHISGRRFFASTLMHIVPSSGLSSLVPMRLNAARPREA